MTVTILTGDARERLKDLPDESVHCCVTSPPYFGLRDYGINGQIGLEPTPEQYVAKLVEVFREVKRVLRSDGTLWLNLGDSYAGSWGAQSREHAGKHAPNVSALSANQVKAAAIRASGTGSLSRTPGIKAKDLIGIPWLVVFALRADGWYLRQRLPWVKRNPMPESVDDRPSSAVEEFFLLSKSADYFYDYEAVKKIMSASSMARLAQDIDGQQGSERANGGAKTNGRMKAVRADKQRGHGRRHQGFNERWDGMDKDEQCSSRAFRNTDLFFHSLAAPHGAIGNEDEIIALDVVTKPFRAAHFATYPPDLIEPLIRASTSEKGCCANCASPYLRLTKKTMPETRVVVARVKPGQTQQSGFGKHRFDDPIVVETLGWELSCKCDGGGTSIAATVIDPFGGAGTTGLVADRLGRNAILIELNPTYVALAEKRLHADSPLFSQPAKEPVS